MENSIKSKKLRSQIIKGSEAYEQLATLIEILKENHDKKAKGKEKVYLFNELDLLLAEGVDVKLLIKCGQYRSRGLEKTSTYRNFDVIEADWIEQANQFLQDLEMNLQDAKITTKYEFCIDDKLIAPTEEQQQFVRSYLKENSAPVNDMTYFLALRRLIIGGSIESKFDKTYFIDRTHLHKSKQESSLIQ